MTPELEALARRAVACPRWRWMPGMRWVDGEESGRLDDWQPEGMARPAGALPDFDDAATVGCLLALVREAWNDPGIACVTSSYRNGQYYRRVVDGRHHGITFYALSQVIYSTESEALVSALEAAP